MIPLSDEHEWKQVITQYTVITSIPGYRQDYMTEQEARECLEDFNEPDNSELDNPL